VLPPSRRSPWWRFECTAWIWLVFLDTEV
jgi:hypothetical protein